MRNRRRCGLFLGMALAVFGQLACSSPDRPRKEGWIVSETPKFESVQVTERTCSHVELPREVQVRCVTVVLPETRPDSHAGRSIELPVVILKGGNPEAAPVVYLEGGPGGSGVATVNANFELFRPILESRDLVVFDQRGTGGAVPSYLCPETSRAELFYDDPTEEDLWQVYLDRIRECRDNLSADTSDRNQYHTRNNAADVDALRVALGYERWHLFGVSYGTRLALDVMRYHPDGVASAVLDSVLPPQVDFVVTEAANAERAFQAVFDECAGQPACNEAYPELQAVFEEMVVDLNAIPLDLDGIALDGDVAVRLLFSLAYSAEAVRRFPEYIYALSERDLGPFRELLAAATQGSQTLSIGMHLSVVCSEHVGFVDQEAARAAIESASSPYREVFDSEGTFDLCKAWQVAAVSVDERAPVQSDLPTLVLAGSFDPVTPPAWAQLTAETLSSSTYLEFPDQSHGVFLASCGQDLLNSFWQDPHSDPSAACQPEGRMLEFIIERDPPSGGLALGPSRASKPAAVPEGILERLRHPIR